MAEPTRNFDEEKAKPLGDTGDGDTGVPAEEQGISNRPGDADQDHADNDESESGVTRRGGN